MTTRATGTSGITLQGIDILLTYRCTGECSMCTYWGSPRSASRIDPNMALAALSQAAAHPLRWVMLFGGEPFLTYPLLLDLARRAAPLTSAPIGVFTNAYWAISRPRAHELLQPLTQAGVRQVYLSLDAYHVPYVPPERVRIAALAARDLGFDVVVDAQLPPGSDDDDPVRRETMKLVEEFETATGIDVNTSAFRLTGRAAQMTPGQSDADPTVCQLPSYLGDSLASPSGVEIHPGGDVCLCAGLSLGHLAESCLDEILIGYDPESHPVIGPLLRGGPRALMEMAVERGCADREMLTTPMDRCRMCYLARRALVGEFPAELSPGYCYGIS